MENKSDLNNQFRHYLNELIHAYSADALSLESTGDTTASILAKIRRNVAEIFLKMYDLSELPSILAFNTELRAILEENRSNEARQRAVFQYYLGMIPRTWEQSLSDAIRHEDREIEMKERVKLDVRDVIQAAYRTMVIQDSKESDI